MRFVWVVLFLSCFCCGCNHSGVGSTKISSGQAVGLAFDEFIKDRIGESIAYEISVSKSGNEWLVSISELPSKYPGDHTIIVLDEFGNITEANPGL